MKAETTGVVDALRWEYDTKKGFKDCPRDLV